MILKAKDAGASAVKFQTWRTNKLTAKITISAEHHKNLGVEGGIYELLEKVEFKKDQHLHLILVHL